MEPEDIARAANTDRATLERVSKALMDAGWRLPRLTERECERNDGHIFATECCVCGFDPLQ